ncbi:sim3 NASP-related protein sim3 [Candida maltosa Xu316]|uniref:Tetratricopeptide SHNi-TPR domain-containing protein n=1 Tax=Candida maltosa (strain Xu316) TaxID=1245528 RepID=M3JX19_CANMX|nr:hypothetical protein G210_2777 [Candida maltosa Xu316]
MSEYSTEITKLIADGSRAYSSKDYDLAAEKYGDACGKYSETHEGNEDADLLLLYGKAVFQSGVSKSEVFGGNPSADVDAEEPKKDEPEEDGDKDDDKFQFYADGDEEEQEPEQPEEQEQEEEEDNRSDFEIAWELLDLARALFENKVNSLDKGDLKVPYLTNESDETDNEYIITVRKLSETYDLLGEVSLEAENFNQAGEDLKKSLELRLELYPDTCSLISESHYKLSLALEFQAEDPSSRKKAAEQMKLAIESVEKRNKSETDDRIKKDNQEMIEEMKEKYQDLLKDPSEEIKSQQMDIIKGILGEEASSSSSGSSSAAALVNNLQAMVKKKPAAEKPVVNDLSASVRKRKKDTKDGNSKKPKK